MSEKNPSNHPQGQGDAFNVPPPPGPPPGMDGLHMNPNEQPIPDSHSELYDNPAATAAAPPPSTQQQYSQQTPHQPPPPDSDGAPKKASWGQRFSLLGTKAAAPFNMLANKLGAETFLPSTMDKEVEKATRILRAFCKDGIYTDDAAPETVQAPTTNADGKPTTVPAKPRKNHTLLTIPSDVVNRAVGLAIFTTARMGFHVSGATGSGIIVARLPDGSWSPPSGIQVHSLGAGLMVGIDIYDCVVVINTKEALKAFTKTRMSLGSDLAIVAGPWGAGGSVDFAAPTGGNGKKPVGAAGAAGADGADTQPSAAAKDADAKPTTPPAVDEKTPAEADKVPTVNEPAAATTSGTSTGTAGRPQAAKERKPSAFKQAIKQPTYSYVKSRGFYAGVQVDGTIITERKDANAAFYGVQVPVDYILKGEAPLIPGNENWVNAVKPLFDTIKGAEGWRGQQGQGEWANEMGAGVDSTYGHGNVPQGYPTGFDPVFDSRDENPPPKPPRPASSVGGATAGVAAMNLKNASGAAGPAAGPASPAAAGGEPSAAQAKAAEAAAEAEMNREREEREGRQRAEDVARWRMSTQSAMTTAPPGYSELARPGEASQQPGISETAEEHVPPPAYADDGTPKPGTGDTKQHPPSS